MFRNLLTSSSLHSVGDEGLSQLSDMALRSPHLKYSTLILASNSVLTPVLVADSLALIDALERMNKLI